MNRSRLIFFVAIVFLVVVILTGALLFVLQPKPKLEATPTVTGTPPSPTFTPVPITFGPVSINDEEAAANQRLVDLGLQSLYTDPVQVAREDGRQYGFSAGDRFMLLQSYYDPSQQQWLAEVRIFHEGTNFLVKLKQPGTQGPGGIWKIYAIDKE